VRILTTKCKWGKNGPKASCNCGVSIKAGDDVFFLSRCTRKTTKEILLNEPLTEGFRIFEGKWKKSYTVSYY
jgi:hypothetical protein